MKIVWHLGWRWQPVVLNLSELVGAPATADGWVVLISNVTAIDSLSLQP